MEGIFTITHHAESELVIKRSRFIARSFRCADTEAALAVVRKIREGEPDAAHHCWAFRVGPTAEHARASDDGEPHGTAGAPILSVLEQNQVTNALIVVTRYFGGIKLGTGGLARAYRDAARKAMELSRPSRLRRVHEIEARVPYAVLNVFEFHAEQVDFEVARKEFRDHVVVILWVPVDREEEFRTFYTGLVGGRFEYTVLNTGYR